MISLSWSFQFPFHNCSLHLLRKLFFTAFTIQITYVFLWKVFMHKNSYGTASSRSSFLGFVPVICSALKSRLKQFRYNLSFDIIQPFLQVLKQNLIWGCATGKGYSYCFSSEHRVVQQGAPQLCILHKWNWKLFWNLIRLTSYNAESRINFWKTRSFIFDPFWKFKSYKKRVINSNSKVIF